MSRPVLATALTTVVAATLVAAGLSAALPSSAAPVAAGSSAAGSAAGAPSFLVPTTARGAQPPAPRAVRGTSRLVTLRTDLLPQRATGQAIGFDLGRSAAVTGQVTHKEHAAGYTAWTGALDVPLGTFTIVRSGSVYRAQISSPQGVFVVTQAAGEQYWLTALAPDPSPSGHDTIAPKLSKRQDAARLAPAPKGKGKGKTTVTVLFAYTKEAKTEAGSKAGIKAAVGQAAADTNLALRNSGIKVKIKVKGIVKTKGKESTNVFKNLRRLYNPHDKAFDSALAARNHRRADVVHLITSGPEDRFCGAGYIPVAPRFATKALGASSSFLSCLPYLVPTHEIGHNLGADHIKYPGVSHDSRVPGSYGWYDVAHNFITTMGYYDPCSDAGVYTCVRIPWYSSPTNAGYGYPIGSKKANNTRVIKMIAPLVARYAR